MNKVEENFIMLKKKVDNELKLLNVVTWICGIVFILSFFINMYFNWKYRGPWDDSNLKMFVDIGLAIDMSCLLLCEMLSYKINM